MVEVVSFQIEHAAQVAYREEVACVGDMVARFERSVKNPNAHIRTVLVDGEPAAIAGLSVLWPGVAEAWVVASDKICHQPVAVTRALKRVLDRGIADLGLHRVHATVVQGHSRNQRFACMLGFIPEATLNHYGPDKAHHILFRKVIE